MKKLIPLLLIIATTYNAVAQLEYYSDQNNANLLYQALLKSSQEKIPQYQNHQRTADPAWFEEYMTTFQEELLYPGVSACFLRDGEVYWKSHHGLANMNAALPVTDQTAYTVASISKTIMITATMQLYEQGLFELDDDISDHIPFLVRNYHHPNVVITIKQLMTHTSSIQDNYDILNDVLSIGGDNPIPMATFLEGYLVEDSLYFQGNNYYTYVPGYTYNYSNVGSCILAYMVEHKTGLDFETYCQQNVFGPLGMEETSYLFSNLDPENLAIPYTIQGSNVITTAQSSWPIYPIGNLKVSALQLAKHLGMNMNQGTFNDSILLESSTVDMITDHHYINNNIAVYMGLIWFIDPYPWFYSHTGRWYGFNTIYGYNKEDNYGMIWLSNGDNYELILETLDFWYDLILYSSQYKPFSIESLTITDEDGDGILEAGETIDIYLGIRNNMNVVESAADLTLTLSSGSPYITSFTDSTINTGDIGYLEVVEDPVDAVSFQLSDQVEPGDVTLDITYSWGEGKQFQSNFSISIGLAEILLVSDEVDKRGKIIPTANWYREVLDSLGYNYQLFDLGLRGDPSTSFINNFPVVIWFTGYDSINTITSENQILLSDYLDNGGKLFLNGQNISDELDGTDFLENYLYVDHVEDTWSGSKVLFGVENDPIGNGLAFVVGQGEGLNNQYSMSIVEPIEDAYKVFTYLTGPETAAIRYENETYKTVFFAFGFEAINELENRLEVMLRILNVYFGVIVGEKDEYPSNSKLENFSLFPNPGSEEFTFSYSLLDNSFVNLTIYDINGQCIKTIVDKNQTTGDYKTIFKADELPAGTYFVVLTTNLGIQTEMVIKVD